MELGLFYFADYNPSVTDRYRLLVEGARFADVNGFASVWTPERHFHEFGGQYPNPAVTSAALAMITNRVELRAGSVVAPLHHPIRIAEDWSVVDNLSGGRVGISFASGWHAVDFTIAPENHARRKEAMLDSVDLVRRLWRRERVELPGVDGKMVELRIFPEPIQAELPVWLTSSGSPDTFRQAGELGVGVLTHLLGQDLADLAEKIREYRELCAARHRRFGHVVLMLHTFLGPATEAVRATVRGPFSDYLRSSLGLWARAGGYLTQGLDPAKMDAKDLDFLVGRAFERYFETGGLFGTVTDGLAMLRTLDGIGVDEVACLIDFVPDPDLVLAHLPYLAELRTAWEERTDATARVAARTE
jgi:natural product biosynthesis luciferase-like monooxygenase protein